MLEVGTQLHVPEGPAEARQTTCPSMRASMLSPGAALPESVSFELEVVEPSTGVRSTTEEVATATIKVLVGDAVDGLPARSVAIAPTVCAPAERDEGGAKTQAPVASVTAVPAGVPSKLTVTTLNASAVPSTVGRWFVVVDPSAGLSTRGATGAVVSMTKELVFDSSLPPAPSGVVALAACHPSVSAVEGEQVNRPAPPAVVVQTTWPSTRTETVAATAADPENAGLVLEVRALSAGVLNTGVANVVSTVNVLVFEVSDVLPAASAAMALTV